MAGRSEKKRSVRERNLGLYYSLGAILCSIVWITRHLLFPKGGVVLSTKKLLWRGGWIIAPYVYSVLAIRSSLRLGVSFSLSNDIFFLTTLVCVSSNFFDWAYYLFLVIPFYGIYKLGKLVHEWVLTPEPESDLGSKRDQKIKRKFKTIRS